MIRRSASLALALCACAAAPALLAGPRAQVEAAANDATLNPISGMEAARTLNGWGTSLAWWANAIGGWSDEAKKAEILDLLFDPEGGLGLNVVVYNIGGGDQPGNLHFYRPGAAVPGFRPAPEAPYTWGADANQRWVLMESVRRGVSIVGACSYSPPWWMTESGSSTGNTKQEGKKVPCPWCEQERKPGAAVCNLRQGMEDAFADYLTDVVRRYRDEHGITFDYLSPMNEPSSGGWTYGGSQEGCWCCRPRQPALLAAVARRLADKGLSTKLAAPEEFGVDHTLGTVASYPESIQGLLQQINTHTYWGGRRPELRALADKVERRISVSEYGSPGFSRDLGPGDWEYPSALELARTISHDLNQLLPTTWIYWQVVEPSEWDHHWGLIHCAFTDETQPCRIRRQYWAYKHFTRHVRPGSLVLPLPDTSPLALVAALGPDHRSLVLVVTNLESEERPLAVDLSDFAELPGQARWLITTEEQNYAARKPVPVRDRSLTLSIPGRSINTLLLEPVSTAREPLP